MTPDEAMLRDSRAGRPEERPISPEEAAGLGPDRPGLGLDWPDPAPFVKVGPDRKGKGIEVVAGVKGTF